MQLLVAYQCLSYRYTIWDGLLYHTAVSKDTPRVAATTHNILQLRIMYKSHDISLIGHRGREKTYLTVSSDFTIPTCITFYVLAKSFKGWSLALHPVLRCASTKTCRELRLRLMSRLCRAQNKRNNTCILVLLTGSTRWYILHICWSLSQPRIVLVF